MEFGSRVTIACLGSLGRFATRKQGLRRLYMLRELPIATLGSGSSFLQGSGWERAGYRNGSADKVIYVVNLHRPEGKAMDTRSADPWTMCNLREKTHEQFLSTKHTAKIPLWAAK